MPGHDRQKDWERGYCCPIGVTMTDVSLRDYIDARIGAVQDSVDDLKDYFIRHFDLND